MKIALLRLCNNTDALEREVGAVEAGSYPGNFKLEDSLTRELTELAERQTQISEEDEQEDSLAHELAELQLQSAEQITFPQRRSYKPVKLRMLAKLERRRRITEPASQWVSTIGLLFVLATFPFPEFWHLLYQSGTRSVEALRAHLEN